MLEITNRNKFPVQLIVRSRMAPRAFTTLNVPGVGAGKNICLLEDERVTPYIERLEDMKLISVKTVPNKSQKGE